MNNSYKAHIYGIKDAFMRSNGYIACDMEVNQTHHLNAEGTKWSVSEIRAC